ncbi:MAG TPA: glutaminase, partial [Burkholderiaceae bacterium]|nr:glutaminase [Burkholderiaceae bacterium]
MNFQPVLDEINAEIRPLLGTGGKVADYIPALARVPARQFGIALRTCQGQEACAGDAATPFSVQSISKLFTLTLAMRRMGDALWERIGREPSGNPFNSLVQLENEQGKPRNPFINAGAIAVADRLVSQGNAKADILALLTSLCGESIDFDDEVAASEAGTGFRNVALANFMKSFGKIDNDVDTVLDLYFHQCAVRMSCVQLA